ncbi:MAG: hypothetical protein JSW60_04995 [Thermoplasmatales archaeon]|nr:MAG: hypothetical protein JSW60_04995 [Thermoplasmatales archaeon]
MHFRKKRHLAILLLFIIIIGGTLSHAQPVKNSFQQPDNTIHHHEIIHQGLQILCKQNKVKHGDTTLLHQSSNTKELEKWYTSHPLIEFASLVETSITIKFIDGSYTVLMDVSPNMDNADVENEETIYDSPDVLSTYSSENTSRTALILNPSEYLYGNHHCKKIINTLLDKGYNIVYLANENVDLPFVRDNLNAEIIYMNTHAGYWDIDGDHQGDFVVIGTGEHWTNETEQIYQFEYENQMIVEGVVGNQSFVAFTPTFIEYYYESNDLPDSLVYMATCHATYDDSMANAFLDSGASTYMGWTRNTVFWTNSFTSVLAFRLFARGFTVKQVCQIIRYGGIYNLLLRSKLVYYGDGRARISYL